MPVSPTTTHRKNHGSRTGRTLQCPLQRGVLPDAKAAATHQRRRTYRQYIVWFTRIIMPDSASYGSMKGAVEVMTKYMAKELGPRRITVNVVAPGAIATDFSGGMVRDNPELNKRVADMTALGRAGLPDDIGPMIASLLTDDNRWVNAQRIEVSGGMSI